LKVEAAKFNFTQLEININNFGKTMEVMHDIILKSIEEAYNAGKF
jgi:hypothetical protein